MSNDTPTVEQRVLAALASGDLTADPETGHVTQHGQPAGRPNHNGYLIFTLLDGGRPSAVGCHRVLWLATHGMIPDRWQVNHRNGRRWDNRAENLEIVPALENSRHRWGNEHAAVGDSEDDNVVSPEWLEQVLALRNSGQADRASIEALKTQQAQPSFLRKIDKHAS